MGIVDRTADAFGGLARAHGRAQPGALPDYMRYILVNNFKFDPLRETPSIPDSLRYDSIPMGSPFYYVVQFGGPITPAMKRDLEATGATLLY